MKNKTPEQLMKEGWIAREDYDFEQAELNLITARDAFVKREDWKNTTEAINHLALTKKIQAFVYNQEAVHLAEESLAVAEYNDLDPTLAHRTNLKYAGEFEKAEKHCRYVVEHMQNNSAARADMRGDLAFILLRTGKLDEAKKEIELALQELEQGWENERMPHIMIWKTKLLGFQSLIEYNLGNKEKAKSLAKEMQLISNENNLKRRLQEAESLLDLFT